MTALFLISSSAYASENSMNTVFPDAIKLALQIGGIPGAIVLAIIVLGWSLWKIANYFDAKNIREKEAYEEALRIKKQMAENTAKMQRDAAEALVDNMDLSYKQDYEYFVLKIKEKNYKSIYLKIAPLLHLKISDFLYDESIAEEERAARIILVMRQK